MSKYVRTCAVSKLIAAHMAITAHKTTPTKYTRWPRSRANTSLAPPPARVAHASWVVWSSWLIEPYLGDCDGWVVAFGWSQAWISAWWRIFLVFCKKVILIIADSALLGRVFAPIRHWHRPRKGWRMRCLGCHLLCPFWSLPFRLILVGRESWMNLANEWK